MDDDLIAAAEAAWQRLEQVSGIGRERWAAPRLTLDSDARVLLLTMPAVQAAHDEVLASLRELERAQEADADEGSD